jgi:sec-independent protein translocase protein TatA
MTTYLLGFLGGSDWVVIGIVIIVLFGAKKVPELMKGLGEGVREFKKASREDETPAQPNPSNPPKQ